MKNQVLPPEQIELVQIKLMALLVYAKKLDGRPLPHCFRHCERIVRNIDIFRNSCYDGIDELTQLIKEDWRAACHPRAGFSEYYIPNDEAEIRKCTNLALFKQISEIEELINPKGVAD